MVSIRVGIFRPFAETSAPLSRKASTCFTAASGVRNQSAFELARSEPSLFVIRAVRIGFVRDAQSFGFTGCYHLRERIRDENEFAIHGPDRAGNGTGAFGVVVRDVIERAVGLHVRHLHALSGSDRLKRADLIGHHCLDFRRPHAHGTAPESLQVGKTRVGADGNAMRFREHHGLRHDGRVAGMKAARDTRRSDEFYESFVVADAIAPEAFAHVAVQIDPRHHADDFRTDCPGGAAVRRAERTGLLEAERTI